MTKSIGPKPAVCILDGCVRAANVKGAARGYCQMHYARVYKYGDPTVTLIQVGNDPVCTVEGCERPHRSRGMCMNHYNQWFTIQQRLSGVTCEVDGCPKPVKCKGLCMAHYARKRKFGDVQAHIPIRNDLPGDMSWCPDCKTVKPKTEFTADAGRPDGAFVYCKPCSKIRVQTIYREKTYASQKAWRIANPDRVAEYGRRWTGANPDKVRAKNARLRAANPEKYRLIAHMADTRRRTRERDAPGFATLEQIMARWEYFGGRCWMCGGEATETEHVKPLSKGGSQWPANLRPSCRPCNRRKLAKWPFPLEVVRGPRSVGGEAA